MASKSRTNYSRSAKAPAPHSQHGSSEAHTRLINETLVELGKPPTKDLGRFWRNETGMALNLRTEEKFKYGLVGSADILGIVKGGWFVGIECKTGGATQSDEQKKFQAMIQRFDGHYTVSRSKEEAVSFVMGVAACKRF